MVFHHFKEVFTTCVGLGEVNQLLNKKPSKCFCKQMWIALKNWLGGL